VPVSSRYGIGSAPRLAAVGGGQSWLVGKSPSIGLSAAVQVSPSLMPPSHLAVIESQIGQGWRKVLHVPPGQSASVMHPKPAFVPPWQLPVSQIPDMLQSKSEQHGVSATSAPPLLQRPVSLTQVPPGHDPPAAVPQPPPPVQFAPGVVPPEHRIGMRSPVRKMPELRGRFSAVTDPATQSAVPAPLAVMVLMTHVLVALLLCAEFGIGNGGPYRQPAFVHCIIAHFALLQLEALQRPPGVQSALVPHGPAQSLSVVQEFPRLADSPLMHLLPPAWAADVPLSVRVLPLQLALRMEFP